MMHVFSHLKLDYLGLRPSFYLQLETTAVTNLVVE